MPKRKSQANEDIDNDLSVPLPFIRPKLGKLCDASCISFERVVVQNILHGQPPSLCEAIQSVSRWKVVQVAFPHVMHACAAMLENRRQMHPGAKFTNCETKLLYTLHWIILDAASECEDNVTMSDTVKIPPLHAMLHPLKTIQLFVYLFAPLVNSLADSDFQSLKLENGLRLWQPLWDYQQPDVPCFSTPVKPQRNVLKAQRNHLKVNTNAANIYIGKGTSTDNLRFVSPFGDTESIQSSSGETSPSRYAPLARLSDSEFCFMSQSESQSVFSMCEFCNNIKSSRANEGPSVCRCGRKDSFVDVGPENRQSFFEKLGSLDRDFVKQRLASAAMAGVKGAAAPIDILSASYFDVAVLQSLFCLQWATEGIHWGLKYVHQRLLEISDELLHMDVKDRERSRSLPFADPRLLRNNSIPSSSKDPVQTGIPKSASSLSNRFASASPELSTIPSDSEPTSPVAKPFLSELRREPPFKKVCMVELRQFPDSTRAVVTRKQSPSPSRGDASPTSVPFKTKLENYPLPKTHREYASVYNWNTARGRTSVDIYNARSPEREKTVKNSQSWGATGDKKFEFPPSPDQVSEGSSQHSSNDSSSLSQEQTTSGGTVVGKPIITITAETPQKMKPSWSRLYDFGPTEEPEPESGAIGGDDPGALGLARSQTDTNISYLKEEEVHEVAGAVHYIQKNGCLNYKVILQAIHYVTKNHTSEKICEVGLNILNCLLDLDIVEKKVEEEGPGGGASAGAGAAATDDKKDDNQSVSTDMGKTEITAFGLAMDSLISIYKSLGCPHGCGDGLRGRHGDLLRQKGHNCLLRLQKLNGPLFCSYMKNSVKTRPIQEVVDFFHAFLGFCVDPQQILLSQQSNRKSVSTEALPNNNFTNNFGHPIGGVGYRGVEGVRTTSVTSESGDEKERAAVLSNIAAELKENGGKSRKSLFRKKLKKILDEMTGKSSPRASLSCNEDDGPSGTSTPKRKFSKFHIGWRKPKSDHEEDGCSEVGGAMENRESKSDTGYHRHGLKGKMSFKTASQATLTFLKPKQSQGESEADPDDIGIVMREKRLVDKFIVKSGMLRFNFLLECCHPGTVPDPQLVASMIQLEAPVSARATLLLECAHFVHRCNHGDWPNWMRLNLPSFRHSSSALHSRGQPSGIRRTLNLQKAAGRLFYSWAENLGYQLEYQMARERQSRFSHVEDVHDERKKRQLRMDDDMEDFLDENTVNTRGNECPYALKMLACLVLQEITTFLRETFQYLPRKKHKLEPGWDKHLTSRRFSSIISSPGHSDRSSESNIGDLPHPSPGPGGGTGSPGERKISFAVQMERSDSFNSSTTSLSMDPLASPHTPMEERKGRRLAQGRQKLLKHLRRGSTQNTSFRQNRSFRMRRGDQGSIKLHGTGSIRTRKVSSQSIHSDSKFLEGEPSTDDIESMTYCSEDVQQDTQAMEEQQEVEDEKMFTNMPWIKVVIQLANQSNFICPHQGFCHLDCYERQRRSCSRLVTSMKKIYQSTEEEQTKESDRKLEQRREIFKDKFKRRESIFQNPSPIKRRESTPLLEKIRTDVSLVKQKLTSWKKEVKPKEVKEDSPMVKYITSQAQKLTQCPLSILTKSAPILNEDQFADIMPVAWELMMETDQEVAAAAASMYLISSVRAPEKAQTMVFKELQHEDPCVRINAILRFGTLWKFRHQVWPRMEEGAQIHFKVPPPNIDFTLPFPTIGLPSQAPIDPPWNPHFKAKIEEVTVNQDQTKSLVTATTTRRKQQQEMIRRALQREEERKRIGRETFPMTTVSVTQLAAVEPSLHHAGEDHEEALQEEINLAARRVSLAPTNRNIASRSMSWRNGSLHWARLTTFEEKFFPSSICAVVLPIIHLLEDGDEELLFILRKLLFYFKDLPTQMAHSLFNYLIGYVMFYVRTPQTYGQEAIAGALALLWQPNIMISANVPSAKKIIVHGPDLTSIPSQFPVHEDTQFNVILQDSLDFFNIPEEEQNSYFLVDTKSNQIHNMNSYVRDFYFFRRNFYPQLSLVHMDPQEAQDNLEKQAFLLKFGEIGKVLFTVAILESTSPHQELFGMDTLHKESWLKLMHTMFSRMTSSFNWSQDLCLFLNVINGCVILHCEDSAMLRFSLATFLNISIHFKQIFSMTGFLNVIPTLMRTYSNHLPNPVVCKALQFVFKQFYILHRKPFMLQLFGSLANILDFQSASTGLMDTTKVQPDCLFEMLLSLEKDTPDLLSILDLVDYPKPFKALDFCYESEPETFNLMQVIDMCVTVVVYSPDSFRSVQMLTILEIVLPRYLDYLHQETNKKDNPPAARAEISAINTIASSMRALVTSCDCFSRGLPLPKQLEAERTSTKDKRDRGSPVETSVFYDEREDSNTYPNRHAEEGRGRKSQAQYDQDDEEMQRQDFRKPRDSLLNVVAEFYGACQTRMKELRKMLQDLSFRPPELLDHKSHNRLADMAHTLLKLATYDPDTMGCAGLQKYMTEILPITDWSQEAVRPALNLILRRLDRLFNKINNPKRPHLKRKVDWTAGANLLKGVFLTLKKFPYIAHLPHLKTLINVLIQIVLSSGSQTVMESLPGMGVFRSEFSGSVIPPMFCSEVVKLVAMQMQALGEQITLEQICGGSSVFPTSERCINMLVNFILPLCIRVGCGRRDTPRLRQVDINFALQVILNILNPPAKVSGGGQTNSSTKSGMHHLSITEHGRCGSMSRNSHKSYVKYQGNELLVQTAYHGLEILMACFDKALAPEWHRVAKVIMQNSHTRVCLPLWKFLNFVMLRINCDTAQEYYEQQTIKDKLQGYSFTHPKCMGSVLVELALELKLIKDEFIATGGEYRSRSATMVTDRSDFSHNPGAEIRTAKEVSDITTEIIGPPKPTLATIGKRASRATILSQNSSSNSAPFKATVLTSSFENGSPTGRRKSNAGQRISAKDGTRILEKFRKPTQDDLSPIDQIVPETEEKVGMEPMIAFQPVSNQNSVEHLPTSVQYENEDIIDGNDLYPRGHRLQRQDAKSRKTFKMKRTKTKTTSVRRFMSRHGKNDVSDTESNSTEGSPTRSSSTIRSRRQGESDSLRLHRTGTGIHTPRAGSPSKCGYAKSVETIHEQREDCKKSSKPRYIQRSKSHDDPHGDIHAPAGTARRRIARQGARMVRSRSPSSSPVRALGSKSNLMSPNCKIASPPLRRGFSEDSPGPAEMPINITYATIPGATSPPQSAQSLKEDRSFFRFSLKKKEPAPQMIKENDSESSADSPMSPPITSPLSPTNPFLSLVYEKPKPVITSSEKKDTAPKSLVKSRIQMFTMPVQKGEIKPAGPTQGKIAPIVPPPIPPRQLFTKTFTSTNEPEPQSPPENTKFKSRDRQRPFTSPVKQRAIAKLLNDLPVSDTSAFHVPQPKAINLPRETSPQPLSSTNPFRSNPDPFQNSQLTQKGGVKSNDAIKQTYVSSRCSSDESLTEFSTLLKEDEKSASRSSVCIYFDGKEVPDTLV
ncbi:UNC80-like protein [Mya arenaria]|uniref:UNC80-like protein n=1 Tax=Mya arenaria TaxID=6604 RepID=A0ABY7EGY3_MYAAR|nr:UNC80-like protein [Mya arenaria]